MALIVKPGEPGVRDGLQPSDRFSPRSNQPVSHRVYDLNAANPLIDLLQQVLDQKWTLLVIVFVCALLGLAAALIQRPLYRAQTSLEIQDMNDKFMDMKMIDPNDTSNYGTESYLQTEIRIAESRSLIERSLARLPRVEKQKLLEPSRFGRAALSEELFIDKIATRLSARPSRQARILDVTFDGPDARSAADFVNILAKELSDYSLERRWKSSQRTREWLERQSADLRRNLEKSEEELQTYARNSGLLFTSDKDSIAETKLLEVQNELSHAQADRMAKQANFDRISQTDADSLPEVINDLTLRDLHVKLADVQRQLSEFQSIYTPQHQSVVKMKAQVEEMQGIFDKRRASIVRQMKNEYEAAAGRERLIQNNFNSQSQLVSGLSEKMVHYSILKRDVETHRQLYDSMMSRMEAAGVASALRATNILVVDPAYPVRRPFSPNIPLFVAGGALCGAILGVLYILFRERASNTFSTPGVSAPYLGLTELAAIPTDDYLRQLALFSPGAAHPTLQLAFDKRSASAESYRALRLSLLNQTDDSRQIRSLVFTSAAQGEGKSTVVSNLGAAMASANRRVLLIDADLRTPRLHELLGLKNRRGLVDLLRFDEALDVFVDPHFVLETAIPGLSLLPAGIPSPDAPELLSNSRLPGLLRELMTNFDMILIDSPPVLPFSDARSLGMAADGIVLIVRAESSDKRAVSLARDRILQDQIPLLGTILTDWDPKKYGFEQYQSFRNSAWTS